MKAIAATTHAARLTLICASFFDAAVSASILRKRSAKGSLLDEDDLFNN